MHDDELAHLSATEHAEAVRSGRLTARRGVEAALARIAERNDQLNAFEHVLAQEALAEADALDSGGPGREGALAGVPVGVKAEIDVAGVVTTYGGRGNSTPAIRDAEAVRRLRAAGAIVVGTTNTPEFGQFPFTESSTRGITRNPADPTRSPGGSSGGSAAAVGAGMVPVALGGDGGGSIRIPASCCGLVGLKPTRGRVSCAPHPSVWGTLGTVGALTGTVADTALVYDVIAGAVDTDRFRAPALASTFTEAMSSKRRLRIGWLTKAPGPGVRVDQAVAKAVSDAADMLRGLGHQVLPVEHRMPDASASFVPQFFAAIRECTTLVEHPDLLERRTRSTVRLGPWARGPVLAQAIRSSGRLRARIEEQWGAFDVVLSPTLACLPPRIGRLDAVGSMHALVRSLPMIAFTTLANVTGHPAMSVPLGRTVEGLPIGVQLMAPRPDETVLVALAAELEQTPIWSAGAPY